jgi:hypothetical protein
MPLKRAGTAREIGPPIGLDLREIIRDGRRMQVSAGILDAPGSAGRQPARPPWQRGTGRQPNASYVLQNWSSPGDSGRLNIMEPLIACERQECQGTTSVVPFGAIKLPALAAVCMKARKTRSSAAKAALHNVPFTARLKSCPDTFRSWKNKPQTPNPSDIGLAARVPRPLTPRYHRLPDWRAHPRRSR